MNIIIYGFGSFAKLMHYYQTSDTDNNVVAFCVDDNFNTQNKFCGLPVIHTSQLSNQYPSDMYKILMAVGYSKMRKRIEMFDNIKSLGFQFINYIHSNSFVDPSAKVGENNIILPGTVIEPYTSLGNNNILWSSVNVSHDVAIQSHNFIATKSTIGGFSKIANNCFLGFNCVISNNLTIESETLVGANSLILSNTEPHSRYWGSPAKLIDFHKDKGIIIN